MTFAKSAIGAGTDGRPSSPDFVSHAESSSPADCARQCYERDCTVAGYYRAWISATVPESAVRNETAGAGGKNETVGRNETVGAARNETVGRASNETFSGGDGRRVDTPAPYGTCFFSFQESDNARLCGNAAAADTNETDAENDVQVTWRLFDS